MGLEIENRNRVCHSPSGRVFRRISPRQGWAIAYAITYEPTSLRTGRALTGTALRNRGRQGDDTPKGRCERPLAVSGAARTAGGAAISPHFASQLGTHFYSQNSRRDSPYAIKNPFGIIGPSGPCFPSLSFGWEPWLPLPMKMG